MADLTSVSTEEKLQIYEAMLVEMAKRGEYSSPLGLKRALGNLAKKIKLEPEKVFSVGCDVLTKAINQVFAPGNNEEENFHGGH